MPIKGHNYTVSRYAHQHLISLFCTPSPSRNTQWLSRPIPVYDGYRITYEQDVSSTHREGISKTLISLSRTYDLYDWRPNPAVHRASPYLPPQDIWYDPPDTQFLNDLEDDDTPWDELTKRGQDERLDEMAKLKNYHPTRHTNRTQIRLCLPADTRRYYAELLAFHNIPTHPPQSNRPDSLTTQVGWCLEVIGTKHLVPRLLASASGVSLVDLVMEVNPRKSAASKRRESLRQQRTGVRKRVYGNLDGTPYVPRVWRRLPSSLANYTQEDVDWAASNGLKDLALEAITLNPNLQRPANLPGPFANSPTPDDQQTPSKAMPAQELYEPPAMQSGEAQAPQPVYLYKHRNITEAILQAYEQHYLTTPPVPISQLQGLADEWSVPIYVIRRLVTQEHVRRFMYEYPSPQVPTTD